MKELEIFVLYEKMGGAVVPLIDLIEDRNMMDIEDYEIDRFWGSSGGIRIVLDGYCVIFDSVDFHYLFKCINFLLHSLFLVHGKDASGIFPIDENHPDDVIVKTTGGNVLHLKNLSREDFSISYKRSDTFNSRRRGERFFEEIIINKDVWKSSAGIALDEYFSILLSIINNSSNASGIRTAMEFYHYWLEVK
ncbi:hypothetical protein SAMN05428949_0657 [Chitinophaga sp. YR627]|uniref:hypothetical protein n=1 Tax=Chitinophaga sp. YR627 TaxID=1881041 RepID=UPI0008EC7B27|nr:hypothetical protein [Chitinophaga sp. YR627]SFM74918.1 hypothetical protein SAMN05428949_0657 [Chitinophaga sp. YR627]